MQHTLQSSFVLKGKGLHTGKMLTATFSPAEENSGIRICRTDLPDKPCYEALADLVCATERGTVLKKGDFVVSTVEHAMSALYAMGVDNCLIETDGPELPILDGSAMPYVEKIKTVGLQEQQAEQKVFQVRRKMVYEDASGTRIEILPDDGYSLDVHIDFNSPCLSNSFASLTDLSLYENEVASARTFVFVREILPLLQKGLIKGGDLENAVVIYDQPLEQQQIDELTCLTNQPSVSAEKLGYLTDLRWNNEPARHKLLDLIGDLALLGARLQGRIIATRPGHTANTAFCSQLRKEYLKTLVMPPLFKPDQKPIYGIQQIKNILPHRYPLLLVDKIMYMSDNVIVGQKNFTGNEAFFNGHFPGEPVVPAVMLLEAMAQTGGILLLHDKKDSGSYNTYFTRIDKAKFRQKIVPGDTVLMRMEITEPMRHGIVKMFGYCYVGGVLAAEAELMAKISK